jgi:predicted glutamine amidotransferase
MSDTPLGLLLFIFAIFLVVRRQFTVLNGRRKIRDLLKKRNAKNITVHLMSFFAEKGVYFYVVTYADEAGKPYMEKYKMHSWDSSIHWVDEDFQLK